jgi:tetratricopeptide (TPR) repeat protein
MTWASESIKMKNKKSLALSRKILVALSLILLFTLITTLFSMYVDPSWKNTQGGIWLLIGKSFTSSTAILVAVFTLVSLIVGVYTNIFIQSENTGFIHQLPEIDKFFTGRKKQLQDLEEKFLSSEANIFGIHGMGGLGKTTLIVAFANRIAKKFDAELFLDMRGQSENPVTPDEAMLYVVRSFNPTYSNLENKSLITGAYRSLLKDKKVLILLDNVKDDAQVAELTPMEGSILLFTSRYKFSLPSSFQHELLLMSEEESCQLLIKIVPRVNTQEAGQIAELCGYLPIALKKAGYTILQYQYMSVGEYISKLSETKNRIGLIDASTSLSYNLLSNELKTAWRKMSVFQYDFGQEVASFILQCDEKQSADILTKLFSLSLVNGHIIQPSVPNEFDIAEYRFKFHDLDRLFANSKIKTKEQRDAEIAIVEHYSTVLNTIYVYFDKGGTDFLVSLSAFDREWVNISHAQYIAKKYSRTNERAAELCIGLCLNAAKFLDIRFPKEVIADWSETALRVSRRRKDLRNECLVLNNLGTAYSDMGDIDRGIPLLERAIEIARNINLPKAQINPLDNLGNAYRRKGDTAKSLEYHFESYKISKKEKATTAEPGTLTNIGNVYRDMGDLKNAIRYHILGLDTARKMDLKIEEINSLINLAADYIINGKIIMAVKSNWMALTLSKRLKIVRLEHLARGLFVDMLRTFSLSLAAKVEYFRDKATISSLGE